MLRLARTIRSDKELCEAVGIHPDTLGRWKRSNGNAYRRFRRQLKRARLARKTKLEHLVVKAAGEDWRAAAWLLSRVHPEEYSEKRILEHRDGGKAKKRREALRDPEVRESLTRAAARMGSLRTPGDARSAPE